MIGTESGFLENRENFIKGIVISKVLQLRGTLNLRVIPLDFPLLLHTERSISQTTCELKEVVFLVDEYTFLWKSINLEQKSRSSQRRLNSEVATKSTSFNVVAFDLVAHVCNRIERCILTKTKYVGKINKLMFLGFLPSINAGVSAEVSQ